MGAKTGCSKVSNFGRICNSKGMKYVPKAPRGGYAVFGGPRAIAPVSIHTLVHVLHNDPLLLWRRSGNSVDHGDRNIENNNRSNLSWATQSEQNKNRKLYAHNGHNCVPVTLIKDGQRHFHPSCKLAANAHGLDTGAVARRSLVKGYEIIKHDSMPLPGENWKMHSPGLEASDLGRVRLTKLYGARMYEPTAKSTGWKYVQIPSIGGSRNVGAIVLEAFGHPMPPGCTVNHKNHDRGDNRLCNLEWATAAQQAAHRRKPPTIGSRRGIEYRSVGDTGWIFAEDINVAMAKTGCSMSNVKVAASPTRRNKTAAGCNGRYEFRWTASNDLEGEVWRPILLDDWSPGGKYDIPGLR